MEKKGACLRSYNNKKNSCVCGQKKKNHCSSDKYPVKMEERWRKHKKRNSAFNNDDNK